jgi:hypothetical protein
MATLKQIQETLSQNTGAQYLYQPVIDRALFINKRKFTATRMILPRKKWNVPVYEFNKQTNLPTAQFVVEAPPATGSGSNGAVAASSSTYAQVLFPVKHWQVQLDLAKFSIQTARVNGDLVQLELDAATKAACFLEEACNYYGSAGATVNSFRPAWDGFDVLMASGNKIAASATPTIAMFDAAIDAVKNRLAATVGTNYAFVMSPEMLSSVGRVFVGQERWMGKTVVYPRDDRGQIGAPVTDNRTYIDGGLEVATYRGVPLLESSFITSLGQMSAVTAADAGGSGSSLTAVVYRYQVEVVTDLGISLACAETTVTPTAGHNVSLTWTAPAIVDADGATRTNLFYRIHRSAGGGAANSETLYAVVAAYNNSDSPGSGATVYFTDTGLPQTVSTGASAYGAVTVATSGNNAAPDGITLPRTNPSSHVDQDIWLIPRDPDICVVPVVNELQTVPLALINARSQQLALIGDQVMALRGPNFVAKIQSAYVS